MLVQVSPDGRNWSDAVTTEARWNGEGHVFSAEVAQSGPGYFRARFVAPEGFQAATTAAVHVTG
ncbi:hypothetical protein OG625_22775 [Streptomyces sp. NBC_01351]|uniref:hypothetical protein n=1 Tax=Streptomyces sp. NBC_01351 TaxID=2903833 RepID=UPI002E36E306|nr:hypothetical protein [Streptomyces sp. NBC_01351]